MNIVETTAEEKFLLRKRRISDGWFSYIKVIPLHRQQELDNYITL